MSKTVIPSGVCGAEESRLMLASSTSFNLEKSLLAAQRRLELSCRGLARNHDIGFCSHPCALPWVADASNCSQPTVPRDSWAPQAPLLRNCGFGIPESLRAPFPVLRGPRSFSPVVSRVPARALLRMAIREASDLQDTSFFKNRQSH